MRKMLRKFSLTGASCLIKKSFLLRHVVPMTTSSYQILGRSYGSGLRFAPQFPFPCPSANTYVVIPGPSVLTTMTKTLKTEPPFPGVGLMERFSRKKTPSKESTDVSVVSNEEVFKKFNVPFLKDDDDENDNIPDTGNINVDLWEKAIKANREWEQRQKVTTKSSELGRQIRQQEQQINGRNKVTLDESQEDLQHRMDSRSQKEVLTQIKLKLAERSLSEQKLDEKIDISMKNLTDPREFVQNLQKQEKIVKNLERLEHLMQLQQQQVDGEVPSQCETKLWKKVLPSEIGRSHFPVSHKVQTLDEVHNVRKSSLERRDFDYPAYTPFNADSDNANFRAQSQKKNSINKPDHVSAICAFHRDRAVEMDNKRTAQGSVKESAIYRLCNSKSGNSVTMQKSLKYNDWGKKQF